MTTLPRHLNMDGSPMFNDKRVYRQQNIPICGQPELRYPERCKNKASVVEEAQRRERLKICTMKGDHSKLTKADKGED